MGKSYRNTIVAMRGLSTEALLRKRSTIIAVFTICKFLGLLFLAGLLIFAVVSFLTPSSSGSHGDSGWLAVVALLLAIVVLMRTQLWFIDLVLSERQPESESPQ